MESPQSYGQAPPRRPASVAGGDRNAVAEGEQPQPEGESEDWYVHAHAAAGGEEGGGGTGGGTQGPMSREEAVRAGQARGGLMVWHPTATEAWAPWGKVFGRGGGGAENKEGGEEVATPSGGDEGEGDRPLEEQAQAHEHKEDQASDISEEAETEGQQKQEEAAARSVASISPPTTSQATAAAAGPSNHDDGQAEGEEQEQEETEAEEPTADNPVPAPKKKKSKGGGGDGQNAARALQREDAQEALALVAASVGAIVEGSSAQFRLEALEILGLESVKRVKPCVQNRLEALL